MCAKHDIPEIHAKLLMKDMYEERYRHEYDSQSFIRCCSKLAKNIDKYEDEPGHTRAIMKPWSNKKQQSGVKVENHAQITHTHLLVKSHGETYTQV